MILWCRCVFLCCCYEFLSCCCDFLSYRLINGLINELILRLIAPGKLADICNIDTVLFVFGSDGMLCWSSFGSGITSDSEMLLYVL